MLIASCSNKKNTVVSRAYNNLTSHYNIYFNGNESFKKGVDQVNSAFVENYAAVLPVFNYSSKEAASSAAGNMDRVLKKCSKVIALHSIKVKPNRDKGKLSKKQLEFYQKKDFNNWIDDCYLLMGKAHFYMHNFEQAMKAFDYILREYKDDRVKYETQVWLARAYNETQDYKDAGPLLEQMEKDKKFPKKFIDELYPTYADFYLKQEKYEESVPKLKLAINKARSKKLHARYEFILAQVYEKLKEENKAYESYSEVIKMNPPYEMAFNAKIKRANLVNATGNRGGDIKAGLNKMLKDAKNIDFQDQIYYALGKIAVKEGKKDEAIDLFTNSVKKSTTNSNQKGLSCIALADLHFEKNNYESSKTYYDSALVFLNESFPGYSTIYKETKNLNRLVTGLNTVEVEDSLQKIANMPSRERDAWVTALVEKAKQEEERIREQQESEREGNYLLNRMTSTIQNTGTTRTGEGGWYFYNPTTKSFGLQDFQRKWGKRKLEDNWRRKNKQSLSSDEEVAGEETEDREEVEEELLGRKKESKFGKTDRDFYLENVPFTDSLMQVSHNLIKKALLIVGEIYYKDLKNYDRAINAFEELISRYPDNEYLLESYYNLFQLYTLKNDLAQSNKYRQLIINKFPESTFAKVLTNPNYFKELEEEKKKVNTFYENTYQYYLNKDYTMVIQNCEYAESNYKHSEIISKFSYLKSLSIGCTSDARTLKTKLNEFVTQYPKSKEKKNAEYILAYIESMGLKTDFYEQLQAEVKQKENKEEMVEKDTTSSNIYTFIEDIQHLFAILINTKTIDDNQLIFNIINHNVDYFPEYDYSTTSEVLNVNYKIITVKYFNDKKQAMIYYNSIVKDKDILIGLNEQDYKFFVISNKNYTTFLKEKSLTEYLDFFKEQYFK